MNLTQLVRQLGLYLALALWATTPLLLSACSITNKQGANTREEVVEIYLESLKNKDEKSILQLIPEDLSAESAIQDKIARLGGSEIQDREILYKEIIKPQIVSVTIKGSYDSGRKKFADKISVKYRMVSRDSGRWFLIMGKSKVPPSTNTPKPATFFPPATPSTSP